MKVHVVLADAMGGVQYNRVFASKAEADQHLAKGVFGKFPRVVEFDVKGAHPDPKVVYVAQTYNRTMDTHEFEGVYGTFENAQIASGPKGQSLNITL